MIRFVAKRGLHNRRFAMGKPTIFTEDFDETVLSIVGEAVQALKDDGQYTEANRLRDEAMSSGSYEEALAKVLKYVKIVSEDDYDDDDDYSTDYDTGDYFCMRCGAWADHLLYSDKTQQELCHNCYYELEGKMPDQIWD